MRKHRCRVWKMTPYWVASCLICAAGTYTREWRRALDYANWHTRAEYTSRRGGS